MAPFINEMSTLLHLIYRRLLPFIMTLPSAWRPVRKKRRISDVEDGLVDDLVFQTGIEFVNFFAEFCLCRCTGRRVAGMREVAH